MGYFFCFMHLLPRVWNISANHVQLVSGGKKHCYCMKALFPLQLLISGSRYLHPLVMLEFHVFPHNIEALYVFEVHSCTVAVCGVPPPCSTLIFDCWSVVQVREKDERHVQRVCLNNHFMAFFWFCFFTVTFSPDGFTMTLQLNRGIRLILDNINNVLFIL